MSFYEHRVISSNEQQLIKGLRAVGLPHHDSSGKICALGRGQQPERLMVDNNKNCTAPSMINQ